MPRLSVERADRSVVEETEAHGSVRLGVVPRRSHAAKRIPRAA